MINDFVFERKYFVTQCISPLATELIKTLKCFRGPEFPTDDIYNDWNGSGCIFDEKVYTPLTFQEYTIYEAVNVCNLVYMKGVTDPKLIEKSMKNDTIVITPNNCLDLLSFKFTPSAIPTSLSKIYDEMLTVWEKINNLEPHKPILKTKETISTITTKRPAEDTKTSPVKKQKTKITEQIKNNNKQKDTMQNDQPSESLRTFKQNKSHEGYDIHIDDPLEKLAIAYLPAIASVIEKYPLGLKYVMENIEQYSFVATMKIMKDNKPENKR